MVLITELTEFHGDLCDVARLFFGDALLKGDADGRVIRHEANGWRDVFCYLEDGQEIARHEAEAREAVGTQLEVTRLRKRACKNALYAMLKGYTGRQLPWGSLTGIRPTRLYAEALLRGGGEEDAMAWLMGKFDVTRGKAELLRDIARAQAESTPARAQEVDVYAGIPFCPTRCSYCSFAAEAVGGRGRLITPYLEALAREIVAGSADLRAMDMRARAVYVGGGTPTTLSAGQLAGLLSLLRDLFPEAAEWTVEAGRPDTIDEDKLAAMEGVNRISINPQTMNDETLRRIGRNHTAADVERAMELVRRHSFPVINMDLIAGLPGETADDVRASLNRTLEMGANNVTVHTLAIKRSSRLRIEGNAELPPEREARAMVDLAAAALRGEGYAPYYLYRQKYMAGNLENVGYAKPGAVCLYNIDNMEETLPILAFGAGAITKWLFPRERRIERAPNVRNIEQYIARVDEMVERKRGLWKDGGNA